MIRKWYFTLSEGSIDRAGHGWRGLIRVAVMSALKHTKLIPHMIYDGKPSGFTAELEALGVKIIYHRVSFYDHLVEKNKIHPGYLDICSAVFLRVDIPTLEVEDDFILFTDCDVVFQRDIPVLDIEPNYFAAAPQFDKSDYRNDMNAGVMVMNVAALRKDHRAFTDFIVRHLNDGWPGCDQENYRRFYNGKWDPLPLSMNWKPYWGENEGVEIVHWHGPKPRTVRDLIVGRREGISQQLIDLYLHNEAGYAYFYRRWLLLAEKNPPTIIGHVDKIANGYVSGWALNEDNLDSALSLTAFIDGKEIGKVICGSKRKDLELIYFAEVGSFNLSIPSDFLVNGQQHRLLFKDTSGAIVKLKFGSEFSTHYELGFA